MSNYPFPRPLLDLPVLPPHTRGPLLNPTYAECPQCRSWERGIRRATQLGDADRIAEFGTELEAHRRTVPHKSAAR
ncbi:hypothetical protein GCM10010357_10160 [Streptomyces luteireticuli]|uniref:Uncharacterized protein n=1 Tax=Streptomyces luteireticuli TaxID=173858 RepID=A0ABP3I6V6_9ACTN